MSKYKYWPDDGMTDEYNEWAEKKFNESKKLERKVIRYALVYLKANFEEEDAEDLEIDDMVLDGVLSRMIKQREEQ